ncbi:MAG: exodeoxyribonuclease III [Bacteroides sp. SM23_62]|nr:MAG: exodeoxyribonuclease III [Bacteroides sp. SM23_62]
MQKIISYNVNGIRAALNKGLLDWIKKMKPAMLCIQETKAQPDQVDLTPLKKLGYDDYWHSAEKKGYSGVLILTDQEPDKVVIGMNTSGYDSEGRLIRLDFGDISVLNVYIPSGTTGDVRQDFKMKFLDDFLSFLTGLRKERPDLLVCGDFNIAHREIDIHNPVSNKNTSGFLPEERAWIDKFLESGFVDSFRHMHPETVKYSWWSFRSNARSKNLGWRLDYHMLTESLTARIKDAGIMNEATHSDHCPVWVDLDI